MIKVKNLTKIFGPIRAVDDVSFEIKKGEVLGFLGPNGAGKSTTMKMITCFLDPTSGDVEVDGDSILSSPIKVKSKIGYMPENAPLYDDMTVCEFLYYIAELRGIEAGEINSSIDRVIDLCALQSVFSQPIGTLSKGFRRRVSMGQALIHDPKILILDEPTDGLDPNQKNDVRELIKKLSADKCIILSTHILEEMDSVCSRAIIISSGKILYDGTPEKLKAKSNKGDATQVFRAITTGEAVEGVTL